MTSTDVHPTAVSRAIAAALRTIDANAAAFGDRYPDDTTVQGIYRPRPANVGWTTGFWPGMLWLAADLSDNEGYARAAAGHVRSFADRVARGADIDTHDLGFLYLLSCVVPWQRTTDPVARDAALSAARHLLTRVLEPAGIIQAWGDMADPRQQGRTIIDSLMNTPLLFWAGQVSGDPAYAEIARRHVAQLRDHILRPDGTTYHTFYWEPGSGKPLRGETEQGYADESCWARGQAWGIYGFAINYRHTGDESFLEAARRCADYFLTHLPGDGVPYWDLEFTEADMQERDSSAAAIAVGGLLELAEAAPGDGERYRAQAHRILGSLIEHYTPAPGSGSNGLLLHGVYDKPKGAGVDEANLWGDYFYLEALTRVARPSWTHPW